MADPGKMMMKMYWSSPAALFVLAPQPHRHSGTKQPEGDETKTGSFRLGKRNDDQTQTNFWE